MRVINAALTRETEMKTLIALLMLGSAAMAQDAAWAPIEPGWCSMNGGPLFPSRNGICYASDAIGHTSGLMLAPGKLTIQSGASVTNSTAPKCDDGREIVMRESGSYGCAKDVIEPR